FKTIVVMSRQLLFLLCVPLLFAGCHKVYTYHYVYRNGTDKSIDVVAYDVMGSGGAEVRYRFSIVPYGAYTITRRDIPGNDSFFPFWGVDYIRLSNGEQTVVFAQNDSFEEELPYCIFRPDGYAERSRNHTIWRTYTFTDRDFEDGVPIND